MRKILSVLAVALLTLLATTGTVAAQDEPVVGTVTSDPATVPEAGEQTVTASGEGFIPESTILLGSCTSPADTLVPGTSSEEDVLAAAVAIDPFADCDIAGALTIETDADGAFTAEVTAEIGPNFFLTAGTISGPPQQGAIWVPIVPEGAAQLAVTGVDSGVLAGAGVALIAMGAVAVRRSRQD